MDVGNPEPWIPTERTHPLYIAMAFGSSPVVALVLAFFWFDLLTPPAPLWFRVIGVAGPGIMLALFDVWVWTVFRPTAVRVSAAGIEVRMASGRGIKIPRENVSLSARPPEGFGLVTGSPGQGFRLSPNQFAAATRFFPVSEPSPYPAGRPLR